MDLFRRRRDRDLQDEIESHIAMAIQDRMDRGEDRRSAEIAARREFGNQGLVAETTRAMWGSALPEQIVQDLRYALRNMRRNPGVAAVIVSSLALGIGANLALFSVIYPALLHPLPVARPQQLVELLQKYPGEPRGNGYWTSRSFEFYRDHNHVFSDLTATLFDRVSRLEVRPSEVAVVLREAVVDNYFSALGVAPSVGRLIGPGDAGSAVAVLSWRCWNSRFDRDPSVVGRHISVDGKPSVVIGVAAERYAGLLPNAQTEVWIPLPDKSGLSLIGRLREGVTLEQARGEMRSLYRFTIEERTANSTDPLAKKLQIELESASAGLNGLRDQVGQPLLILMAIVSVLFLLACVNVAGILLAQAAGREREIALRSGLGASRGRLLRQVMTESCLLSAAATVVGAVVAFICTSILLTMLDSGRPHERIHLLVEVDRTVVSFAVAIALCAGFLFGLPSSVHAIGAAPASALRQMGGSIQTRGRRLFGRTLVSLQVALALSLLSLGALFGIHLAKLRSRDLGFRRDGILLVSVDAGRSGYRGQQLANVLQAILHRVRNVPGVRSASVGAPTPLMGAGASGSVAAEGFDEDPEERRRISISWVAPQYFGTLSIPILAGRDFDSSDEKTGRSAIISRAAARYYFGEASPVGRRITLDKVTLSKGAANYEIVGIAGDTNYREIRESDRRLVYLSAFGPDRATARTFVVRTDGNSNTIVHSVQQAIRETAASLAVSNTTSLSEQIDASIVPERMIATLSGFFAAIGGLLAGIGLYGLLAYSVTRRTNEIGVRVAFGATYGRIVAMVVTEAFVLAAAGLAVGLPLAIWGRNLVVRILPDVSTPPVTALATAAATLLAIAAIAAYVPARRAARVDAMQCLRHD